MEITEQELKTLRESAARSAALEAKVLLMQAREAARGILRPLLVASSLPAVAQARVEASVLNAVTVKEGALDAAAFTAAATEAIKSEEAYLKEAAPAPAAPSTNTAKPFGLGVQESAKPDEAAARLVEAQKTIDSGISLLSGVAKKENK